MFKVKSTACLLGLLLVSGCGYQTATPVITGTVPALDASGNTTNPTPTIQGTGPANAGIIVEPATGDGDPVCTTKSDAQGAWACTPTDPLAPGPNALVAVATTAGQAVLITTSGHSNTVTIDEPASPAASPSAAP